MNFNFFTFGGTFFWEDIFFYQKWRIQRNCITGHYRLLDSWDIRRACGSFETCQQAFASYINIYELQKQHKNLVILLHGYMDSKNIFKHLWRKFMLTDSTVAALNYPSLFRNSLATAHQLLFFLNHIEDVNEVSFVTKGTGNMVLQKTLNFPPELQLFRDKMKIGNIVEINPVRESSLLCEFLTRFKFFRFICGPTLLDMTEKGVKNLPHLPQTTNYLRIYSESKTYRLYIKLLEFCKFPIEDKIYSGENTIYIKGNTFRTLENEEILSKTVKFIRTGKI